MKIKSILQSENECFVCHTTQNLHTHHIFEGGTNGNRKMSEKYNMTIRLCERHHNMSDEGIHYNKALDLRVKQMAQEVFEQTHTRDEFREIFGKSYL